MKLISAKSPIIESYLGKQKEVNGKYRIANYCTLHEYKGQRLLYNNLTKHLYTLGEAENDNLINNNLKAYKDLIDDWTIVPEQFDEKQIVKQACDLYNLIVRSKHKPNFTIFTTTKCNARCFYCFEHGQKRIDMSEKTANDVADFIIKKSPDKECTIKWFGGEPLFNTKVIDIICNKLKKAGITYNTNMTTNGYLFDESLIKKAEEEWHIRSVVITLDGTADNYKKIKNYIYDDPNPFNKIINNIDYLLKTDIRVNIRLNVSLENHIDLMELANFLKNKFYGKKNFAVLCIGLYDLEGKRDTDERTNLLHAVRSVEEITENHGSKYVDLRQFSDLGTRCMAEMDHSFLISPTGELGTCEHFSEGDMMYGSIYSEKENVEVKNYFKTRTIIKPCETCPLLPNCMGVGKCPTQTHQCDDIERSLKLNNLYKAIEKEYNDYSLKNL